MNTHLITDLRTGALLDTDPHGPNEPPTYWLHQSIPGHGTEPADPELLDAAAQIIGRRIVGAQLASGGHAQVNIAMVRSRLKRWAIQQERIDE